MGGALSSPSTTRPNLVNSPPDSVIPNMSSADSKTLDSDPQTHPSKPPIEDSESNKISDNGEGGGEEEEKEEEGECGFCLFMKAGGCRESFIGWENCIEEAEKNKEDIVEKCFQVTSALKKCMEANADYYAPILRAEKAAEEEALKELEKEKEKEKEAAAAATAEKGSDSTDKKEG